MRDSLRWAKDFIRSQDGSIAPLPVSEEEFNPEVQDDLSLEAVLLERKEPRRVPFDYPSAAGESEFRFFQDGRQQTIQIGHIPVRSSGNHQLLVPVHYVVVAAAILERANRRLTLWRDPLISEGILVAKGLVPHQHRLAGFEDRGLTVIDTDPIESDYHRLRRRALHKAKDERLDLEQRLIRDWRRSKDAQGTFLVIDGTLMNLRDEQSVERCVGVSKSFGSRYFSVSDHNRIMSMTEFQRSWAFRFHSDDSDLRMGGRERLSWYLRLRSGQHKEPEYGLVRVEIGRQHAAHVSELADRFSRSLLADRLPTSYPAPRWDKHLFPIRACERYLTSIMPSKETVAASMGGSWA